jgi:adenosylcobinamide-GDP ribazoletransferase
MNDLLAACIFFTRLPFWRIRQVPPESFRRVMVYWPLTGWLTAGVMAGVLWLAAQVLPFPAAVLLALAGRVCLTGALHEDGLADFLDGFGGGKTREQILSIMKDSSAGSYGLIGLILYYLLLWSLLSSLPLPAVCALVMAGDIWAKALAGQIPVFLPYARKEAESKSKLIYERPSWKALVFSLLCGVIPLAIFLPPPLWPAGLFPVAVFFLLLWIMKKRLQAYTGDCCGATFLLCELSFYLGICVCMNIN